MISLVIFLLQPCFCVCAASPASHVHLSYKYLLQGCVLFSNFVLTRFFISVCIGQSRSLARSLTMRPRHTLFVSLSFYFDVNSRRTLPLPLNHSLFTCPASARFQPPLRKCVL